MNEKQYANLKWLSTQKQWQEYKAYIEGKVQVILTTIMTDETIDLKPLQIRAKGLREAVDSLEREIADFEFDFKEKTK